MKRATMVSAVKNFHLPLPENVYAALREEAAALKRPATVVAREAIEAWLRARRRASVRESIRLRSRACGHDSRPRSRP